MINSADVRFKLSISEISTSAELSSINERPLLVMMGHCKLIVKWLING